MSEKAQSTGTSAGRYQGYSSIVFERIDDILRVQLRNPRNKVNAVDAIMHDELRRLFAELRTENEARCVLLTGSGKAFSAGGDFDWMRDTTPDDFYALRREGQQLLWNLLDVEVPIVAAVNGPAIGLGGTIALYSDVIFMADSAVVADPHVSVGLVAGDGGAVIWPMTLGPARAKEYLLTGDPLTAADAHALGLVNRVVPAERLEQNALEFARRLCAGAPLALRYTKAAVNHVVRQNLAAVFDYSTALEVLTFASGDHREALDAIRENRAPNFSGR